MSKTENFLREWPFGIKLFCATITKNYPPPFFPSSQFPHLKKSNNGVICIVGCGYVTHFWIYDRYDSTLKMFCAEKNQIIDQIKKTYLKSDNIYECEVDAYSVLRITNTYFGIIAVFLLPKI